MRMMSLLPDGRPKPHYRLHYKYHAILNRYVWFVTGAFNDIMFRTPNCGHSAAAIKLAPQFIPPLQEKLT